MIALAWWLTAQATMAAWVWIWVHRRRRHRYTWQNQRTAALLVANANIAGWALRGWAVNWVLIITIAPIVAMATTAYLAWIWAYDPTEHADR